MVSHYQCSQSSRWFRRTGSSENIHENSLRSGVNDTGKPACSCRPQPERRSHNFDRANENAAVRSVTHKSSGKKGSEHVLRSAENSNQNLRLLSEKLIFVAVAGKGLALQLCLSEKQQNRSERSCGLRYDASGGNSEYLFSGQNDPAWIDIEVIILASPPSTTQALNCQ